MSEYDNNSPYHAIFVNDVKGTTYDDVYFCGNSVMRKNVPISFEGTAFSSDYIYIVIPHYFQINKECVTHTYPTVATSPTGKGTRCSECGYIDLRVTGQMLRPIPVNSTHTITANTNYTCYKIYVTIQYGLNGTPTTTAFYSTDSVSKAFTFTQKGLYFIKIQAMDSPETEPTSALRQHIFSVRVY